MTENPREIFREAVADLKTYLKNEAAEGVTEVDIRPELLASSRGGASLIGQTPSPSSETFPPSGEAGKPAVPRSAQSADLEAGANPVETLKEIQTDLGDCTRCRLCEGRKNIVFGVGNPNADLVIVGEAPGRDEDIQGEPFVGRAGQLLTRMLAAIGLRREDVYICNVIKCRPPENRNPLPDEVASCEPFLVRQIRSLRPKVILAMGKFAAQTLLNTEERISGLRGRFREYQGVPVMPTFHPAYLLRNPAMKREVWKDMQLVMDRLGLASPARRRSQS